MKKIIKNNNYKTINRKIHIKDRRILNTLCTDARTPLNAIAKKAGLSPEGVAYRIRRLEEQGIITKYTVYPDEYRFGLQVYHAYFKIHTLPAQNEEMFKRALVGTGYCSVIRKTRGHWDFIAIFFAKDPFHLDELLSSIFENQEFSIKEYRTHFVAHQYCFSQLAGGIFEGCEDPYRRIVPLQQRIGSHVLKENEVTFLKALDANARATYAQLSKETGVPQETLRSMFHRLQKEGIIITTFAALDKFRLGYTVTAIDLLLTANAPSSYRPLVEHLATSQHVHYAAKITGAAELHAIFLTEDTAQFEQELERIRGTFHQLIEDIEIHPIYAEEALSMFPQGY